MIVRSFEIRAAKETLVCDLAKKLDRKLCDLQSDGWNIISVTATPVIEYAYPTSFESTLFTIIAGMCEKKEE